MKNPQLTSTRMKGPICLIFGEYLMGIRFVFGGCLDGVLKVSGRCLVGVWKVSEKFWNMSSQGK